MDKKIVVQNLRHNRKWAEKQGGKRGTPEDAWRAEQIMVGCVQIIKQRGRSIEDWADRKPERRSMLKRIQRSYKTARGRRVLLGLIDFAISELEAAVGVEEMWVGALPLQREPKPLTDAQRAALTAGRADANKRRKQERESRERALETCLSSGRY